MIGLKTIKTQVFLASLFIFIFLAQFILALTFFWARFLLPTPTLSSEGLTRTPFVYLEEFSLH